MSEAREVLIAVLEDVEAANVPEDLREVAFAKLFDLRAGNVRPNPPGQPTGGGSANGRVPGGGEIGDTLAAIASRIGVSRDTVAEVYDVRDGEVQLIIGAGKLPPQVAAGTKEIALLVAGGRQAAGIEEWTSWDEIREVCGDFKRLDSGNFAKTIRSMEETFNFRKESERKTVVKLSRPGWESFASAVKRLGGES